MGTMTKREFLRLTAAGAACLACPGFAMVASTGKNPGKFTTEAHFYTVTPRGVQCGICPNECTLKPGEESTCRNRINKGNKLYSVAYGNPCAVHIDPVEKKPFLHFMPKTRTFSIATAGCNFACLNCQNWEISQTSPAKTRNVDLMPPDVVKSCIESDCASISYTYSEPISFYEYMFDTAKLASEKGIRNIMVSNGFINPEPLRKLISHLDAANIDLKAFDSQVYLKLTGGKMQPVLDTLVALQKSKVWLEITNLIVPSWNDNLDMISRMCKWLAQNGFRDAPLHFSRFTPLYKLTQLPSTPLNTLLKAREAAVAEGLKYVYIGNVPGRGFENTLCPSCGKLVIERRGYSILSDNLENGSCKSCRQPIAGVWN
ncbi:MAG TPA: AmmeMemoRadiSam system radical SAM enzyme [Prolixibacteraceae bacterium]|jgi:pyruvate formate lyase activating enzyme|nr:AmmeMemoRadiSam system radical SAM enzyme [Bacteroidales bacterium]HNU77875.1 AmmeMemoRadiSam system radical SAM enzyme [Prolixibacteraceae bacterium]HOY92788.1 AmmeMemoRadiSam system radical SAM enzyme [Prolixibacteraceae bacterium]HPI35346.1 AmmeMemoRadiSam system radical SAM enzyme [Prolixibacteraceae bacterium]HPN76968.1 AmmeMemoRadiSam system radical SAM enzyme [Prolixibacteraceae bacterium]